MQQFSKKIWQEKERLRKKWEKYTDNFDLLDDDAVLTLEESKIYMQNHIRNDLLSIEEFREEMRKYTKSKIPELQAQLRKKSVYSVA